MEKTIARQTTKTFEVALDLKDVEQAIRKLARAPEGARVEFDIRETENSIEFAGAKVTYSREVKPRTPAQPQE